VQEFPFISKIRVGFETQLIETTKCIPTVINEKVGADIFIRTDGEKNESLYFIEDLSITHKHQMLIMIW